MADPLLTVRQVAGRLGVSEETVRRWLRRGQARGVHLGPDKVGWRVTTSEVERIEREGLLVDDEDEVAA